MVMEDTHVRRATQVHPSPARIGCLFTAVCAARTLSVMLMTRCFGGLGWADSALDYIPLCGLPNGPVVRAYPCPALKRMRKQALGSWVICLGSCDEGEIVASVNVT